MPTRFRLAVCLPGMALIGVLIAGCSDSSATRSVLSVTEVNENKPLASDVAEGQESSYTIREDAVVMTVRNSPHDGVLDLSEEQPYGYVILDRYEIQFSSSEAIPPVSGALGWKVLSGDEVSGSFVVVPASYKTRAPLLSLRNGGEIQTTAVITIIGHEATSGYTVKTTTSFPVNFANWTDTK
jgi:hypothetical protein